MLRLASVPALLCLTACNPFSFLDLEDEAPVRSYNSEQAEFGQQIAVYTNPKADRQQTWVAISSNRVSRYQIYQVFEKENYVFPEGGREGCAECDSQGEFDVGALGFAAPSSATNDTNYCVVTPFNGTRKDKRADGSLEDVPETGLSVDCDRELECGVDSNGNPVEVDRCTFRNSVTLTAGAAIASVYGETQTYAQLLVSDPKTAPYLFRMSERNFSPVDFVGTAPADGFGEKMVSKSNGTGTRIAATQNNEVHLFDVSATGATSLGCLDVGEEVDDLAWVNDSVAVGTTENVSVYPVASFSTPCSSTTLPGVTCADLPTDSYAGAVSCAGLGAAVGAADVDGDGSQELLLGAPLSDVSSANAAGAVFIVPDAGESPQNAVVVVDAEPKISSRLGATVRGVPVYPASGPREEVAAGAPGARGWRLFLCSDFPGDDGDPAKQCAQ